VSSSTLELVHLRASQINGSSFCVDSGARSAKQKGETDVNGTAIFRSNRGMIGYQPESIDCPENRSSSVTTDKGCVHAVYDH